MLFILYMQFSVAIIKSMQVKINWAVTLRVCPCLNQNLSYIYEHRTGVIGDAQFLRGF